MESDEKYGDRNLEAKLAVETVTNSHPLDCRWSAFDRKTYTSHYTTSINQLSGIRAILSWWPFKLLIHIVDLSKMTGRPGSTLQLRSRAVFTVDLTKEPKETQNDETEDAWETKPNTRSKCDETARHASCRARSDVVMYLSLCVQTTCTLGHGRWAWSWVLNGPSRNSLSVEPSCLKRWSLRTELLHSFPLACVYVRWKCFYYGLQTHRSWYAAVTRTLQHSSLKLGWLKRLSGQSFVVQDKEPMLAVWLLRPHEVEMIRPLFFLNFCRIIFFMAFAEGRSRGGLVDARCIYLILFMDVMSAAL